MSASSTTVRVTRTVTRVTRVPDGHILPAPPPPPGPLGTPAGRPAHQPAGSWGRPVSVGIMQIILGVVILGLGISMASSSDKVSTSSGSFVWGPVVFLTAGSLTVAAGVMSSSGALIKFAAGFNVFAALTAIATFCIFIVDHFGYVYQDTAPYSVYAALICSMEFSLCLRVSYSCCRDTSGQSLTFITTSVTRETPPTHQAPPTAAAPPPPYEVNQGYAPEDTPPEDTTTLCNIRAPK